MDSAAPTPGESRPTRRPQRRRPHQQVPVGNVFIPRLGAAAGEAFAGIDDVDEFTGSAASPMRPTPDTPIEELRFVALDCETTGQSPHRLVELGAVAFTLGGHIQSLETLVHTVDRINPYARRIHGISSYTLAGAPLAVAVIDRFVRFMRGAVLVEHSADAFDTRLIAAAVGGNLDADNLDTSRLAGRLWGLRDTIGLERLCSELGVHHRRPHHALADAEATAACFVALVLRGRDQFHWHTLGDLLAVARPTPPRDEGDRRGRRRSRVRAREGRPNPAD